MLEEPGWTAGRPSRLSGVPSGRRPRADALRRTSGPGDHGLSPPPLGRRSVRRLPRSTLLAHPCPRPQPWGSQREAHVVGGAPGSALGCAGWSCLEPHIPGLRPNSQPRGRPLGGHVTGRGRGHPCHLGPGAHLRVWGLRPVRAGVSAGIVPRPFSPKWGVGVSPHEARLSPGLGPCGPLAADPVAPPRPLWGLLRIWALGTPWTRVCSSRIGVSRLPGAWTGPLVVGIWLSPKQMGASPPSWHLCPGHWAPLHRQGSGEAAGSETWRALCWASGCCFQGA